MGAQTVLLLAVVVLAGTASVFAFLAWRRMDRMSQDAASDGDGQAVPYGGSFLPAVSADGLPAELGSRVMENASSELEIDYRWLDGSRALELRTLGLDKALLRFERVETLPDAPAQLPSWIPATTHALVQRLPETVRPVLAEGHWVVTFPPKALAALKSGDATLMKAADGTIPKAVSTSTGGVLSNARVVGQGGAVVGGGALALTGPQLVPIVAAAGAAYLHQRWLDRTLGSINRGVLAIGQRLRDDDQGRLEAATGIAHASDRMLGRGGMPQAQLLQLAQAKLDADAIYHSRRRLLDRFLTMLDEAQHDGGALPSDPWVGDAAKALEDPEHFQAEVTVYLHALVARARVSATLVSEIAAEGFGVDALIELGQLREELLDDFWPFQRRLRALARNAPDGRVRAFKTRDHQRVARALHESSEEHLVPLITQMRDAAETSARAELQLPLRLDVAASPTSG